MRHGVYTFAHVYVRHRICTMSTWRNLRYFFPCPCKGKWLPAVSKQKPEHDGSKWLSPNISYPTGACV